MVLLAIGIYMMYQIVVIADINSTAQPKYSTAMESLGDKMIIIVGIVVLAVVISLLAVALAIFGQSMPGGFGGRV
jgi:hypothetical protein